jgi:hypothetical protein
MHVADMERLRAQDQLVQSYETTVIECDKLIHVIGIKLKEYSDVLESHYDSSIDPEELNRIGNKYLNRLHAIKQETEKL